MEEQEYICEYCGEEWKNKNSLTQHMIRCKLNPNRLQQQAWNLGKTKITDARVKAYSDALINKQTGYAHYQRYLADNSIAYGQQNMQCYKKIFSRGTKT